MKGTRWLLGALAATGCASVSPKGSFDDVSALVAARGGARIHWDQGTPADDQIEAYRDYLDTVRDYWITRAELERATGGSLDAQPTKEMKP